MASGKSARKSPRKAALKRPRKSRIMKLRRPRPITLWINHLALLPGDPSVTTTCNLVSSGVGSGLSGLVVQSSTVGGMATGGGGKGLQMGVQVPPGFLIKGVRVCYELTNARSFISQVRLAQLQDPPATALVLLDDPTHLTAVGPLCVNSQSTTVDPTVGAVRLNIFVNFGDTHDAIVIRGVGLRLARAP